MSGNNRFTLLSSPAKAVEDRRGDHGQRGSHLESMVKARAAAGRIDEAKQWRSPSPANLTGSTR
jgi:hypothetical protein